MRGKARHVVAFAAICASACGTGNTKVDPGDLELRDLLGVSPEAASKWDDEQRASARRLLTAALDEPGDTIRIDAARASDVDERVKRTLSVIDDKRFASGHDALGLVHVELAADAQSIVTRRASQALASDAAVREVLFAIAGDAGHRGEELAIVQTSRLPVIAAYVAEPPARLLVNPVLVASIDPSFVELSSTTASRQAAPQSSTPAVRVESTKVASGNPYSFYGSVGECAYAQRLRCEACLPNSNCDPITDTSDGNAECNMLAANNGRGYFLICINLSLAITSVNSCAANEVSGCARDTDAASDLGQLESNANFLDDAACGAGLDTCLAKIYGAPKNPFPGLDGGMPQDPPRDVNVTCGESCDSDSNSNCDASPSCNCDGPSCNNSFSCDSTCSSSNDQSGCGDNCDSCSSDDGGGGGGGGGCSSDSGGSSGGGDCGGGCGGCSDGGSSGGSSGGGCGGGGGGDCGGGGGGGDCGGGGGGGGGCQIAKKSKSMHAGFALALSLVWGLLPVPVAAFVRRRHRRRAKAHAASAPDESLENAAQDDARQEDAP